MRRAALSIFALALLGATAAHAESPAAIKARWEAWRASGLCVTDSSCVASLARYGLSDDYISADGPELQDACKAGKPDACDYLAALWPELQGASR